MAGTVAGAGNECPELEKTGFETRFFKNEGVRRATTPVTAVQTAPSWLFSMPLVLPHSALRVDGTRAALPVPSSDYPSRSHYSVPAFPHSAPSKIQD